MKYYLLAFKKAFDFKNESSVKEFWYFFFINLLVTFGLIIVSKKIFNTEVISNVYRILSLLPLISLGFRRLRNAGLSPWLFLIPIVNLFLAGLPQKEN